MKHPILAGVSRKQLKEFFEYLDSDFDSEPGDRVGWVFKGTEEKGGDDGGEFELQSGPLNELLLDGQCRVLDLLKAAYQAGYEMGNHTGETVIREKIREFGELLLGKI